MKKGIIFRNIKLPFDTDESEAISIAVNKARKLGISCDAEKARIHKKSVDARKINSKPFFIYSVAIEADFLPNDDILKSADAASINEEILEPIFGTKELTSRPIIVGFGPCGMFAALILAEYGYKPIVLERGADAISRRGAVKRFYKTGILESSNIQFGAGGAGTFSDGKLVTRINDPKCSYVLKRLHELGAPEEITYAAKPHVGTDKLLSLVCNAAHQVKELGGEILYNTALEDIVVRNRKLDGVKLSNGETREASAVILAIGHSARDTYQMLFERGLKMMAKPFSVGVRIEHFQKKVDESLYGKFAGDTRLPKGEYALSHREGERAVYTFCMCPGGEVVAAASEDGGVVTNGMSKYARDGRNANAAIAVSVSEKDFGGSPLDGIEFQRKLERAAFKLGGGGFTAPCETVGDYLEGKCTNFKEPKIIRPTYMNSNTKTAPLDSILPSKVNKMLRLGLRVFSSKMRCFSDPAAVLTGVETRTSAPLRIIRGEDYKAVGIDNLYPCGEGAGYAGGITSAAVDGVNAALAFMSEYAPIEK